MMEKNLSQIIRVFCVGWNEETVNSNFDYYTERYLQMGYRIKQIIPCGGSEERVFVLLEKEENFKYND